MKFNTEKLNTLLKKVFEKTWTVEENDSYKTYIKIINEDLSWDERLINLHNQFLVDIKKLDIDSQTGYFTTTHKDNVRYFCRDLFSFDSQIETSSKEITNWISDWFSFDGSEIEEQEEIESSLYTSILPVCEFYVYGVYWNNWDISKDTNNTREIYLKAVKYHEKQGFKFNENEDAVRQLLNYFSELDFPEPRSNSNSRKDLESVASVLSQHIKQFGDKSDYGYAYNGFNILEKSLSRENVPDYLVEEILKKYCYREISGFGQYRKQVEKIISIKFLDKRNIYLLLYLDIPLVVEIITSKFIFGNYHRFHMYDYEDIYVLGDKKISFLYEDEDLLKYDISWDVLIADSDLDSVILSFTLNDAELFKGKLTKTENELKLTLESDERRSKTAVIIMDKKYTIKEEFNTSNFFENFLLDNFNRNEYRDLNSNRNIAGSLIIDYVYIKNYKTLNNFHFWLTEDDFTELDNNYSERIEYKKNIYGEKIESLKCVVGKNGSGKTSLIQFLTQIMYPLILEIASSKRIYGSNKNKSNLKELDNFYAIIRIQNEQYWLGNKQLPIKWKADPQLKEFNKKSDEFTVETIENWGVYDFSNSLTPFTNAAYFDKKTGAVEKQKEDGEVSALKNWSEDSLREQSRIISTSGDKPYDTNSAMLHYFSFCQKIMEIMISNINTGYDEANDNQRHSRIDMYVKQLFEGINFNFFLRNENEFSDFHVPAAKDLDYGKLCLETSSGQFTKLLFFSKLHAAICRNKAIKDLFTPFDSSYDKINSSPKKMDEVAVSALLFIDESEIYQHPEWQRNFIYLLFETIELFAPEKKYQLVIATNSPFFLSDVFPEDICFIGPHQDEIIEERTFGQNIHTLLSQKFFMEHTIGQTSFHYISSLFELFNIPIWNSKIPNDFNEEEQQNLASLIIKKVLDLWDYLETSQTFEEYEFINSCFSTIKGVNSSGYRDSKLIENQLNQYIKMELTQNEILVNDLHDTERLSREERAAVINEEKKNSLVRITEEIQTFLNENKVEIFKFYFSKLFPHAKSDKLTKIRVFLKDTVIESIGEKIYRNVLLSSLDQCFTMLQTKKNRKELLEEQLETIKKELEILNGDADD